jgi:hypothetical protein
MHKYLMDWFTTGFRVDEVSDAHLFSCTYGQQLFREIAIFIYNKEKLPVVNGS